MGAQHFRVLSKGEAGVDTERFFMRAHSVPRSFEVLGVDVETNRRAPNDLQLSCDEIVTSVSRPTRFVLRQGGRDCLYYPMSGTCMSAGHKPGGAAASQTRSLAGLVTKFVSPARQLGNNL